ncbi:MAG: hypothetical protein LQ346_003527 [Caloplaca aetnensis]|nr:MAG: hypothetical protein LQ346_003527 [Caloplaca aetnensis]
MTGRPRGSGGPGTAQESRPDAEIGFFPAITHFADAISALPKEMVRHYSMMKEVDAKICAPEEKVGQLVTAVLQMPAPPKKPVSHSQNIDISRSEIDTAPSTTGTADNISIKSVPSRIEAASTASQENLATFDFSRRQLFHRLRVQLQEMLPILDEKNHVLSTAHECLENQLKRCNSSYRHLDNEISEEARYGSLNHWAYSSEKTADKKGTTAGERSRRDVAAANHLAANAPAVHEAEGAALRSELRREVLAAARKSRNHHLESDFDDTRAPAGKKSQGAKGRRVADTTSSSNGATVGLGIANGTSTAGPPAKRRKIDKVAAGPTPSGVPMNRAMNSVFGSNTGPSRGAATSPRATPALEPPKKRGRLAAIPNGTGRKRYVSDGHTANTNASAANSPSMASSPVMSTFPVAKEVQTKSPAPSLMQRVPSSRGRQNSAQSLLQEARNRPPSNTANKATAGKGTNGTTADVEKVTDPTDRSVNENRTSTKEAFSTNVENLVMVDGTGEGEIRGAPALGVRGMEKSMKKEDPETAASKSRQDRPRSISISTRGNGKASKTATPTQGSFAENQRTRPIRAIDPGKRSHKKGAGLAAQMAAAVQGDEEGENKGEPLYCYCNQISYGEMVACDMEKCPREWFHLDCLGWNKAPKGTAKWFCDECKENLKKGKMGNGNGR